MVKIPSLSNKKIKPVSAPAKKLSKSARKPSRPKKKPAPRARPAAQPAMLLRPKVQQETINVIRDHIEYEEGLSETAGFLAVRNGMPPIVPPNGDTLLHLLFFLIYTAEGASVLAANGPSSAPTPDEARANLKAALRLRFPTLDDDRLDAVIDAHIAADLYVEALEADDEPGKQQQEAIYQQKLLAILGELYDDAMGHEFSMRW